MDKNKMIGVAIVIIVLIIVIVVISKNAQATTVTTGGGSTTTTSTNILDTILGYFGLGKPQVAQVFKCDCNKPGFTTDGKAKDSCREGRADFSIDCE